MKISRLYYVDEFNNIKQVMGTSKKLCSLLKFGGYYTNQIEASKHKNNEESSYATLWDKNSPTVL